MFQRKSKPEQVRESAESAMDKASANVGAAAGSVLTAVRDAFDEKVAPKVGPAAETASARAAEARERGSDFAHQAKERAAQARDRAVSNLDHQIDAAVPKGQEAIAGVGPKVDHARDVIVDDILPKISEMLGNVQTSKDEVLSRQDAPIAAITGAPKKKKRKGGALLAFGVAAALGAAVAYYLNSQKKPPSDPWATEHHVGGAPGVDAQVRASLADRDTATSGGAAGTAAGGAGAAAGSGTTGVAGTTGVGTAGASDTPLGDRLAAKSGDDLDGGAGSTKMLAGDEIDQLAAGSPVTGDEEIPGTSGSGTSGFGTDFGADSTKDATHAAEDVKDSTDRKTDLP